MTHASSQATEKKGIPEEQRQSYCITRRDVESRYSLRRVEYHSSQERQTSSSGTTSKMPEERRDDSEAAICFDTDPREIFSPRSGIDAYGVTRSSPNSS